MLRALLLLISMSAPAFAGGHAMEPVAPGTKVAFFGITYLDESLQRETAGAEDEEARVAMLEEMVRTRFAEEGIEFLDTAPVAEEIDRIVNPAKCYGCDARAAAKLGAEYSLVGEVQKVSNLILSMNLQMRDATTGETVRGRVVDIRDNSDEAWARGMRYILKTTFFREE
ncbi:DUF3280 domain-containing protein [Litorisediminicola beolgyonensis]|uniref:DUF3280 domain-containing protein n=1 Tax=Litorisediminicola beolgyonensis TaxID=1173614 RepID=A0ABW3ZJ17_9RHOB